MAKEKKVYLGSGTKKSGNWFKATLKAEVLNTAHWQEYEGKKFLRLNINILDEPDKYGKDVSITLDTWKPEHKPKEEPSTTPKDDDLPF